MLRPKHTHTLAVKAVDTAPHVFGLNGQFTPESAVNQNSQFDSFWTAMRQQSIHSSSNRPACEQDIVDDHHLQVLYSKIQIGHRRAQGLVPASEVISKKCNVQVTGSGPNPTEYLLDSIPQARRKVNAPRLDPNQGTAGKITVLLDQLVGETIERQPELKWVDEEFRWTHNAAQK